MTASNKRDRETRSVFNLQLTWGVFVSCCVVSGASTAISSNGFRNSGQGVGTILPPMCSWIPVSLVIYLCEGKTISLIHGSTFYLVYILLPYICYATWYSKLQQCCSLKRFLAWYFLMKINAGWNVRGEGWQRRFQLVVLFPILKDIPKFDCWECKCLH